MISVGSGIATVGGTLLAAYGFSNHRWLLCLVGIVIALLGLFVIFA